MIHIHPKKLNKDSPSTWDKRCAATEKYVEKYKASAFIPGDIVELHPGLQVKTATIKNAKWVGKDMTSSGTRVSFTDAANIQLSFGICASWIKSITNRDRIRV